MRILHIWDQAGVACVLAKYQHLQGHDSSVIIMNNSDKFGIYSFYQDYIHTVEPGELIDVCFKEANTADIVHIHSLYHLVPRLRGKFGSTKKIILHYHGSELRGYGKKIAYSAGLKDLARNLLDRMYLALLSKARQKMAHRLANAVLVSTPDLLNMVNGATYIPNPVDTEHFKPETNGSKNQKKAVTMKTEKTEIQWTLDYCKKNNIDLDIDVHDRTRYPIMYGEMPRFLGRYEIYVDIRYISGRLLENLSKSALESLACGIKVLDFRLEYRSGLPSDHSPLSVLAKMSNIYSP